MELHISPIFKRKYTFQTTKPKRLFNIGTIGYLYYEIVRIKGVKHFAISNFSFPQFPFTSSYTPQANTSKSPSSTYATPQGKTFILPSNARILNGTYCDGMRVAYCNGKYAIVNSKGNSIANCWFEAKPKFFNKPYGRYSIIAYVSYNGRLYAIDEYGRLYDMKRMWNDAHLKEALQATFNHIITEALGQRISESLILESERKRIARISEGQLRSIILEVARKMIA